jgi:ATP-binding cassette subfamily B protein
MTSKYRMIWRLMEGQRLRYGAAVAALVLGSCVMYLVPLVPQVVIDGILTGPGGRASEMVRRAVELGGGRDYLRGHLWIPAAVLVGLTAIAGVLTYLRSRWSAMASEGIILRLRNRLYDQIQHLPCSYHDKAATGDQVQRCTSDVETFRQFLANQVVEIGRAAIMMIVPIPLMLALDPRMTLVSVIVIPPIVIFSVVFFRRVRSAFKQVDEAEGKMTSTLQENLTGIRVVRAFARQDYEKEKFEARNSVHRDLDYRLYKLMAWYWSTSDFMCMGQKALVLAAGGYWLATGQLKIGSFYFFLTVVNMFIWPVRMMGRILTELGKATVSIGRIGEILEHERESDPVETRVATVTGRRGEIVFERVVFNHGGDKHILDDISFRISPGQTVALLGPSGSGKSTIVNLLLRFYDPESGLIRMDGQDIATMNRKAVRSQIAVVMQEPFLYSKTLRENIRLGRQSAPEPEITEVASMACVHASILEFEKGYDTLVGERGVTLSGGQRQRVAIARALLGNTPVLILDDALSAVDTETESMILQSLAARRGRHTTILIAHRLSTLMSADRILVLDRGRVIQEGTHASLLEEDGLYRRLWDIQNEVESDLVNEIKAAGVAR